VVFLLNFFSCSEVLIFFLSLYDFCVVVVVVVVVIVVGFFLFFFFFRVSIHGGTGFSHFC
jgi:hypothetical protein